MKLTRRDFLKFAALFGVATTVKLRKQELLEIFAAAQDYWHIAWLNAAACTGCAISFAQTADPDLVQVLTSITVGNSGLPIALPDYMQVVHPASGRLAGRLYEEVWKAGEKGKRVLIVEGAIQEEGYCEVVIVDRKIDFRDWLADAAKYADYVIAFGSCASFGGVPHGKPNPTGAMGVRDFFKEIGIDKSVINLPRCPGHPDSLILTLASVIVGVIPDLDKYGRPLAFYGMNIHDARCQYRPYYDRGIFIQKPGEFPAEPAEEGCRYKIGCKGPITYADCAARKWNEGTSWCVEVGAPCIGCSEPEFPDGPTSPFYTELPGLPVFLGIPVKTWGEALVVACGIGVAAHLVKRVVKR